MTSAPLEPASVVEPVLTDLPTGERAPRWSVSTMARLAVAAGVAGIVAAWLLHPVQGGDTGPLLAGTATLGRCLGRLDLVACEQPAAPVGPYPVLQYVPDLVADAGAELSEDGRRRVLAVLSVLGVAIAVGAAWLGLTRTGRAEWRWAILLAAIGGPLLAYGSSTWGEPLAIGLLVLLVAAALVPARPVVVGLAAFGASLTKETGYPFVVALGLVALLLARRRADASIRRHVAFGAAGVAAGMAVASAFNLLRFGTPRNAYYLDPALRQASPERLVEFAAGLVASPNGGLAVFWPLAFVLLAALVCLPLWRVARGTMPAGSGWPAYALLAIALSLGLGLATWWSPFGWWAWGPRLALPWVLPLLLLAIAAFGPTLLPFVARLLAPTPALILVAMLLVLATLPHVGFLWDADGVLGGFFLRETEVCPGGGPPPTPAYYACLREQMWTRHPIWLDALSGLRTAGGLATAAAVTSAVTGALVLFRREVLAVRNAE